MSISRQSFFYPTIFFVLGSIMCGCFTPVGIHFLRAKEAERGGRTEEAVEEYLKHMQTRLMDTERPESENPYLYYIFIGDLYLKNGDVVQALDFFKRAKENDVYEEFIVDRYRQIAKWYEQRGELERAIDFLRENRELDEDLFDLDIDRLHKQLINQELSGKAESLP